jgi:acyl transferase domain-containing protein
VSVRATLLARLPSGAMSSVEAGEHEIAPLLGDGLSIAAVNGPRRCVVSGPRPSVEELETRLAAGGIHVQRLRIRGAGHSAQVDGILEEFGSFAAGIRQRPGQIPAVSNLSGTWLTPAEAIDPAYWKRHLRAPVRFVDGLRTLLDVHEDAVFVEVGPGTSLSTLTRQNEPAACVVSSLPHPLDPAPDGAVITRAVGQLWLAGADIDWPAVASRVGAARNVAG